MTLRNATSALQVELCSRKLVFNGVLIWMNGTCQPNGADWTVAERDAEASIDPLFRPRQTLARVAATTVVIDAGHGGMDTGATGPRRVEEKAVTLDIARRVKAKLRSCDVDVRLTRQRDEEIELPMRTEAARRWGADVFVSIHMNSARNGDANGIETYVIASEGYPSTASTKVVMVPSPGNHHEPDSTLLAYYVHKGVLSQTKALDRGIKHARFELLREAPCAATLVECGFVSNRREARNLTDADYRDSVAEGLARGILTYISKAGGT